MPDVVILPVAMASVALGCLAVDLVRLALRRPEGGAKTPLRMLRPRARPPVAPPPPDAAVQEMQARVRELEGVVRRLRDAGHSVVSQRDAARAEAASLRLALGTTQQEVSELRRRLLLEGKSSEVVPVPAPADRADAGRFRSAKLAFARLYHPDNARGSDLERSLRTQVFKEFWAELERIERS